MLRTAVPLLCCIVCAVIQVNGQSNRTTSRSEADAIKPYVYDVVSIRQIQGEPTSAGYGDRADGFWMLGLTLKPLIPDAYGVRNDAVSGWPKWAESIRFDIEAKMDAETADALRKLPKQQQIEQRQRMLQSLLADRFGLKVHHASAVRTAYELVVAKHGLKMKANNASRDLAGNSWQEGVRPSTDWETSSNSISGHAMPISILVNALQGAIDSVIVDKTELTGRYDVTLHWDPVQAQASDSTYPQFYTALEEQLGLRLKSTKAVVGTIIIDHLDMPSPN